MAELLTTDVPAMQVVRVEAGAAPVRRRGALVP